MQRNKEDYFLVKLRREMSGVCLYLSNHFTVTPIPIRNGDTLLVILRPVTFHPKRHGHRDIILVAPSAF